MTPRIGRSAGRTLGSVSMGLDAVRLNMYTRLPLAPEGPSPSSRVCTPLSACPRTASLCCDHLVCCPSVLKMIAAALAQGGMQVTARFPPTTSVSAIQASSIPLGGQPSAQVFTGQRPGPLGSSGSSERLREALCRGSQSARPSFREARPSSFLEGM